MPTVRIFCMLAALSFFAACAASRSNGPVRKPDAPVSAPAGAPAAATTSSSALVSGEILPDPGISSVHLQPAAEYFVQIDSEPAGGTIVVDGVPVGKAPMKVVLRGTAHGFFLAEVSFKVRFVAAESGQDSQTVESVLTPLDKIPAAMRFTPAGAQRVTR